MEANRLLRLLQLSSPSLPIGAYAYSQGVESAVHNGEIKDENEALNWLKNVLLLGVAVNDMALLFHAYQGWETANFDEVSSLSQLSVAIRETAELKSEDYHLGKALLRLADPLGLEPPSLFSEHVSYPIVFAYFMHQWKVSVDDALMAFSWSWSENQIAAMIKLIPLGQTQGQKLMINMDSTVLKAVALAKATPVSKIGSSLPNLAILSSQHETQYSRLFRS